MISSSRNAKVLLGLLAALIAVGCAASSPDFDVKFGQVGILYEGEQPYQALIEETTVVPRDVGGETALGFVIYPKTDESYEVYSVHHLPEPPRDLGSSGHLTITEDGAIRTMTDEVSGARVYSFGFDEGDPLGTYKIDVFVNGQLVDSAIIEVVESGIE